MERRRAMVEVMMPDSVERESAAAETDAPPNSVGAETQATANSSAASTAPDCSGKPLAEKAIAKLPADLRAQAVDKTRKAKSSDPGWNYGWWPDVTKKDFLQCVFCKKVVPAGIKRFKQHLAGGYGDAAGCPESPEVVKREMNDYLLKNSKSTYVQIPEVDEEAADEGEQVAGPQDEPKAAPVPSSGTRVKLVKKKMTQAAISTFVVSAPPKAQTQKYSKSVSAMLCKTPEEVVAERHKSKTSQPTLEHCTKKSKEAKQIVDDHACCSLFVCNYILYYYILYSIDYYYILWTTNSRLARLGSTSSTWSTTNRD
jgi:hypothetical protein